MVLLFANFVMPNTLEGTKNMKKNMLLSLTAIALANTVLTVSAATDGDYPAANFQPKVVFIDDTAKGASSSGNQSAFDPKFPAASFQPKVVYIDKASAKPAAKQTAFDPKFPASSFQPKVIYP